MSLAAASAFDVKKQLGFYGSYHRHPVNIGIHIVCVPLIMWSAAALAAQIPLPSAIVPYSYVPIAKYLAFETNVPSVVLSLFQLYYFTMEPLGALIYLPEMFIIITSANAFMHNQPNAVPIATGIHVFCWLAQFAGHGIFEGRAPALFDSLLQALVLAPFFVHLEMLFPFGFKPQLHKDVNNLSATELTRVRKLEGEKKRAAEQAKKAKAQ